MNAFFTGRFEGSFARGLPFQENPLTGDARISGTCASLAGLEQAVTMQAGPETDLALRRILLIHSVILSIGGIPLIYLGDEIATLNDYSYRTDPDKAGDSRWVHRPAASWDHYALRKDESAVEGRVYCELRRLIGLRKQHPAFGGQQTDFINTSNPHVFGYVRSDGAERLVALCNFREEEQFIPANELRIYGLGYQFTDLVTGEAVSPQAGLRLGPYQFAWLV